MIRAWAAIFCLILGSNLLAQPPVTALAFAPDGNSLVAGSQAGIEIRAWPSLNLTRKLESQLTNIQDAVFSPDAARLLIAGGRPSEFGGFEIRKWPECRMLISKSEHEDVVYGADWSADGNQFAVVSGDQRVATWKGPKFLLSVTRTGHSRRVLAVQYLPGTELLASAGVDQTIRVWNRDNNRSVRVLSNHTAAVYDLAVRPGDHGVPMIASAGADRTVRLWQPTIGRMVRFVRLERHEPLSLAWTTDGTALVAACTDGQLRVIDPNLARVKKVLPAIEGWAYEVAISKDNVAAVGGSDGQLRRVDLAAP